MTSDVEIAWLAGFLEGEGSFLFHIRHHKGYTSNQFTIAAATCDMDVAHRAADLLGGSVSGPYVSDRSTKPYWRVQMSRRKEVLSVCRTLYPWMGERRKTQIDQLITADAEHPARRPGPRKAGQQSS